MAKVKYYAKENLNNQQEQHRKREVSRLSFLFLTGDNARTLITTH